MQIASSAKLTCSESRSASEYTATVLMPSSRHAQMMRSAISPRLAIRIDWNTVTSTQGDTRFLPTCRSLEHCLGERPDGEQLLAELDGLRVLDEDGEDLALDLGSDLVHQLHRLDDAERLALLHFVADVDERIGFGLRGAMRDRRVPTIGDVTT